MQLARFATPAIAGSGNQRRRGPYRLADTARRAVAAAAGQAFLLSRPWFELVVW